MSKQAVLVIVALALVAGAGFGWYAAGGSSANAATADQAQPDPASQERIVSLGGSVTEILYRLGKGGEIVGVDTTSLYPADTNELPKVGYLRQLSAEGVLSLNPTLVIGTEDAGPPHVVEQLRTAGVKLVLVPKDKTKEGLEEQIDVVARTVGQKEKAKALKAEVAKDWARLKELAASKHEKPNLVFIYARGGGVLNVSGTGTAADAILKLVGGTNAVTGYEGYRPLTSEAMVQAEPDVIIMSEEGLKSLGGAEALWELPGVAMTPAAKSKRVLTANELALLGFGPRTPATLAELSRALNYEDDSVANVCPYGHTHDK